MSSDEELSLILLLVMGGASVAATLAGGFFGTRKEGCQAAFTPWTPCTDECDVEPTRSRKYVITAGAAACPFIDGYTETESCGSVQPCCELERDWQPEGMCSTTGLQKFTRRLKENKAGACEDFPTETYVACCREEGDWQLDGTCGEYEPGKQRYKQTTVGCPVEKDYRYEDCAPCVAGWSNDLPSECPDRCGYRGETFTKTWNVITEKIGTGTCAHPNGYQESLSCPSTDRCPCPGEFEAFPSCPTDCGQPETTVYRFWQPGTQESDTAYQPCPTSESKTCPATPSCCARTKWTPSGQCTAQGQRQVRTVTDCTEDTAEERYMPCCEYTPWTPSGQCTAEGTQKQLRQEGEDYVSIQTSMGNGIIIAEDKPCAKEETLVLEQDAPCCGYTSWTPSGQCTNNTQKQVRSIGTVEGCGTEETPARLEQDAPCCGYTEWTPSGQCTDNKQKQVRSVATTVPGCAPEETEGLENDADCCGYTEWEPSGACTATADGTGTALSRIRQVITSTTERPCAPEQTEQALVGSDPCCEYTEWKPLPTAECVDGQITLSRTKTATSPSPCVRDPGTPANKEFQVTAPCTNCDATLDTDFPSCPTDCGYGGGYVYKEWTVNTPQDSKGYGLACPTGEDRPSLYCPPVTCETTLTYYAPGVSQIWGQFVRDGDNTVYPNGYNIYLPEPGYSVQVKSITIEAYDRGSRYDDVNTVISFEIFGVIKADNSVVSIKKIENHEERYNYWSDYMTDTYEINSSTYVDKVFVRLYTGKSTGRGDYMGETNGLKISVDYGKTNPMVYEKSGNSGIWGNFVYQDNNWPSQWYYGYVYTKDGSNDIYIPKPENKRKFSVKSIKIETRNMDIRYDDVEFITSYEVFGVVEDVYTLSLAKVTDVSWVNTYPDRWVHEYAIDSTVKVDSVYVRMYTGKSTGRGDYAGETRDLKINLSISQATD